MHCSIRVASVVAAVIVLAAIPCASQSQVIVANNIPSGFTSSGFFIGIGFTNGSDFTNEAAAQQFRSGASGELLDISASVDKFNAGTTPLTVSLFTASANLPGTLLGSKTFDPSQVSSNAFTMLSSFDLSSLAISLTGGSDYVVTFTTTDPLLNSVRYRALLTTTTANDFGHQPLFSKNGGSSWQDEVVPNEIGLIVRVQPSAAVPEPSSIALLAGLGVTGSLFALRRLRRRKK